MPLEERVVVPDQASRCLGRKNEERQLNPLVNIANASPLRDIARSVPNLLYSGQGYLRDRHLMLLGESRRLESEDPVGHARPHQSPGPNPYRSWMTVLFV